MKNSDRKLLLSVQQEKGWEIVEKALEEYIERIRPQDGVKKDTGFNTLWYLAENEGGIKHLTDFFEYLEEEARKHE